MRVLSAHDGTDFDAFASLVAAKKIYPDGEIVLAANLGSSVREFISLHKDRWPVRHVHEIDWGRVTAWVVLDVRRASRLRPFGPLVTRALRRDRSLHVTLYDHHAAADDDLPGDEVHVERTGSATTLLVEALQAKHIAIDPVEATLFAIGIHVDTGSLTFSASTPRDVRSLAWLYEQGARLDMVNRYVHPKFPDAARRTLAKLLGRAEVRRMAGEDVAFVQAERESGHQGLDLVVGELAALEGHRVLFVWTVTSKHEVQLIARAVDGSLDVGAVASKLGGGGHATAAAARFPTGETDTPDVASMIAAIVESLPVRVRRASDVMSSRVDSVRSTDTLASVIGRLRVWHYTGIPIIDDGALVGMISASDLVDLDRSVLHHPVASRMRRKVITAAPDEPLEALLNRMVEHDVGRLPVVRDGHVIGIVARSDVRRALYGLS